MSTLKADKRSRVDQFDPVHGHAALAYA